MRGENVDIVGDEPVRNDAGKIPLSEETKQKGWHEHYERFLNVVFEWDPDNLSDDPPLEGLPITIIIEIVKKAIYKMKSDKAAIPSGEVVMIREAGVTGVTGATMIRNLDIAIIRDQKVPIDWEQSLFDCLYKGWSDAFDRGSYRGLILKAIKYV